MFFLNEISVVTNWLSPYNYRRASHKWSLASRTKLNSGMTQYTYFSTCEHTTPVLMLISSIN